MFKLQDMLRDIVIKMRDEKPLTKFEKVIFEQEKAKAKRIEKLRAKFDGTRQHIGSIDTGDFNKKGERVHVPVFIVTNHTPNSKYTGEKLRKIRKDQAKSGAKLHPELKDKIVDLWTYPKDFHEPKTLTRQQRRNIQRVTEKQEKRNERTANSSR